LHLPLQLLCAGAQLCYTLLRQVRMPPLLLQQRRLLLQQLLLGLPEP
jgi:hypothetical protein